MNFNNEIDQLLHKNLPRLPHIECAGSLAYDIDDLVSIDFQKLRLAIVDDDATAGAYGNQVFNALKGRFPSTHITLTDPKADDITARTVHERTASCDALIAVGSGTINDLCKHVSFTDGKPYSVFPTAASMNGYSSANASITLAGHKTTLAAHMPHGIFCDLSIIAAAPARLNKSGFGDSLARPTAQADWLLSHLLLGTPYNTIPFELLRELEPELFDAARGIALADPKTLGLLMRTLLLSGLGMTIAGGSHPASQGEHMIAHAYGMLHPSDAYHGEEIGITTLMMAQMQDTLLASRPAWREERFDAQAMADHYGPTLAQEFKESFDKKTALIEQARAQNPLKHWDEISHRIAAIALPAKKILNLLEQAQAPTLPATIGWETEPLHTALHTARFTRDRFTFLDIA